jgi:hypothetical protein
MKNSQRFIDQINIPVRFVALYALVYGALRLLELGSFKLFIGANLPQAVEYVCFLVAVTSGIITQLMFDFGLFILVGAAAVGVIYSIRLGVKWLLGRSEAEPAVATTTPEPVIVYGDDMAMTFGEKIERK